VARALTHLRNQIAGGRPDSARLSARGIPVGSGVTEAACEVLVKQRLCGLGMRWTERGAAAVLAVRALPYTTGRWSQFRSRIEGY
jgi:hypothetical protein